MDLNSRQYVVSLDMTRTGSIRESFEMRHNDDNELIIELRDSDGIIDLNASGVINATLLVTRKDKVDIPLAGTITPEGRASFKLKRASLEKQGMVEAVAQFYFGEDSRISTPTLIFNVLRDPAAGNIGEEGDDKTLIEVVLKDGPIEIQKAIDVANAANQKIEEMDEAISTTKLNYRGYVENDAQLAALTGMEPYDTWRIAVSASNGNRSATARWDGTQWIITDVQDATIVNTLAVQLADKASKRDYDVRDYIQAPNVYPSPTWAVNRDAFQAANDDAFANGGGRVVAPPGEVLVKGIVQDSNVEFYLPGVVFKNPDGISPSVISSRVFSTTGNSVANNKLLTLANTANLKLGAVVIVHHAGGMLDTHFTALTNPIDEITTTVQIDTNDGKFPSSGYMIIGSELISYTSISGTSLNGVVRGALGTNASTHSAGDFIGVARHFYAEVTNIDGNDVTLSDAPLLTLTNTTVSYGIVRPSIKGLKIDANKIPTGHSSSVYGLEWTTTRWGHISDFEVENGDMGGSILSKGATENILENIRFHNCGVWESASPKGSGLWLFQGCRRNRINNIAVTGKAWTSVYMDDRTTVAEPFDAPNLDNVVNGFVFDTIRPSVGFPPSFVIVGSSRNKFLNGFVRGTITGFEIDHGGQYLTADSSKGVARDNEVAGVHFDVFQPWIIRAEGNRLHEATYTDRATSVPIVVPGNLVYAVTTVKGQPVNVLADVKFANGTASSPGITWADDTDTGFYKDSPDIIRVAVGGQLKYSFYGTEFRMADGVTLATGTVIGTKFGLTPSQKLGFFGKTPMVQPNGIADLPVDATLQQVRDAQQLMIVTLRNLGLIGSSS